MIKESEKGYIALTTSIILGAVLLILVISFAMLTFFNREGVLKSQFKDRSHFLATACVEKALLEFAKTASYSGSEVVTIGSEQCSIGAIESDPPNTIIRTTATVSRSQTNLKLMVDEDINIISLEEE